MRPTTAFHGQSCFKFKPRDLANSHWNQLPPGARTGLFISIFVLSFFAPRASLRRSFQNRPVSLLPQLYPTVYNTLARHGVTCF